MAQISLQATEKSQKRSQHEKGYATNVLGHHFSHVR